MRVLFLSRWYPYPADNGSKLRVSGLLHGLCERHEVTLISFCNPLEHRADPSLSGAAPVETHVTPYHEFQPGSGRALLGYLSSTPRYLIDTHNPEMERLIRQAIQRTRFDLVVASQLSMAAYHESFRGIPAIFEEAELGTYWPGDDASLSRWTRARRQLTWAKHARFMAGLLENFALCTVASDVERRLMMAAAPGYGGIHVIPNSVNAQPTGPSGEWTPASLIFTGSLRFAPNHDAVTWFLNDIFPALRADVPGVRLTITGDPGPQAPASSPGVVLAGHVADVRPLLASSAVSLAPIRLGGGTRLKILEAMAVGTPVVATSKAMEGLDARHEEHLLIADSPDQFAAAVRRLLRDPVRAREMADRAWHLCRARYDTQVVVPEFLRLVDHAAAA